MTITWLGHACFCVEEDNYAVVLDPYTGVRGYPALQVRGNEVLCSHQHSDHNYCAGVTLRQEVRRSPFTVEKLATFHDAQQGALRGSNTVHILRCGDKTVVHLGDLGHLLSPEQARTLQGCDVLLLPVGGVYTIDALQAKAVVEQLRPRVVVPMHYRHDPYGLANVADVTAFLSLFPTQSVQMLSGNSFTLESMSAAVVVPQYPV